MSRTVPKAPSRRRRPRKVPLFNVANVLTIVRLILTPVFIGLLVASSIPGQGFKTEIYRMSATFIFILASGTDQLDGYLARRYNLITDFGKIADPIADKLLVLGAFLTLSYLGELYWWFTLLVIFRELAVTLMRMFLLRVEIVLAANWGGKIKTTLQIVLVVVTLVGRFLTINQTVSQVVAWTWVGLVVLTFVVTMLTGIQYAVEGLYQYLAKRNQNRRKSAGAGGAEKMTRTEASVEAVPGPATEPAPARRRSNRRSGEG